MGLTIILRCIIIYTLLLLLIRIMGKKQIGQMQPYELVVTLTIADLACIPMSETALPILHGIIPLITIVVVHTLLSFLDRKSLKFRKFLNGTPVVLVSPKGIEYENLKRCDMDFNDLQDALRGCGYFKLEEIHYAIIQTNGSISVLPKAMCQPATPEDLKVNVQEDSLPMIIISEGKIVEDNLKVGNFDDEQIKKELKKAGFTKLKEIMIATIDCGGKMYLQDYKNKYKIYESSLSGEW